MRSSEAIERVPMYDRANEAPAKARDGARRVEPAEPLAVVAWLVTGRGKDYLAEQAQAVAWTVGPHPQVWVRYLDAGGREGFAWLWASAVRRA